MPYGGSLCPIGEAVPYRRSLCPMGDRCALWGTHIHVWDSALGFGMRVWGLDLGFRSCFGCRIGIWEKGLGFGTRIWDLGPGFGARFRDQGWDLG